ncbi:MAG TPA: HXXEE domain-containing protein, partial [Gemmatimonadaceae bacterium]|nr:HXXEE domain-containing protein [Gemmatimonadaceae bacterium]
SLDERRMLAALALITVAGFLVALWADRRPESKAAWWAVLAIPSVMLLNVLSHAAVALLLRGYAPGLATAVALTLPFSLYLLRRAARERWVGRGAALALAPAALLLHGPGIVGLLTLVGRVGRPG